MKKTSTDGVVIYEVTTDAENKTVTAHVVLKSMMSTYHKEKTTKPWRKFNTKAARHLLVSEGYEVGNCTAPSPTMNNSMDDTCGQWTFEDLSAIEEAPPEQPRKKRTRRTSKSTKEE